MAYEKKPNPYAIPSKEELAPTDQQILDMDDPMLAIAESMAERGFDSLWTEAAPSGKGRARVFTDEVKLRFLRHLATSGRTNFSATACGISVAAVYAARKSDPVFDAAVKECAGYFRDLLVGEMFRRGVTGYEEEVVCGKDRDQVIKVKKYSDRMLEKLAQIHMPELQRKSAAEIKVVKDEEPKQVTQTIINNFDFSSLPAEDLEMYKKLIQNKAARDEGIIEGEVTDARDTGAT